LGGVNVHEVGVASSSMSLLRTIGNLFVMSLVDLLVHYYLGNAQFTQEQNRALIQTVGMALNISLAFLVVACVISAFCGKSQTA
jgi:hypothetical protein